MQIAVTGSSGLIGTALRRVLSADGHQVVPVVRSEPPPGERAVRWDPQGGTSDAAGLEGLDGVVHLAGEGIGDKRWSPERKRRIEESRLRGTTLLAETLADLDARPPVLVSASAIGYYGDRGDERLTEQSAPGDDFLARMVVAWEAATAPAEEAGIRVAKMRTGIVQTRHGGALRRQLPFFRLGVGGRLGNGRQYWSWISMDDVVGVIRWLLTNDVAGPVNVTGPEPVTNAEYTATLARVLRRPALLPVPKLGPRLVLGRELADQVAFVSQRALPAVLEERGYPFRHRTLEAALRAVLDRPADR